MGKHLLPGLSVCVGSFDEIYEFGAELGRGAFSIVYRTTRKEGGTHHALKVIQKTQAIGKLESEISMSMGVKHPGLVSVSAVYETASTLGLEMELLEGKELFDAICDMEGGGYTEHDAANIVAQVTGHSA